MGSITNRLIGEHRTPVRVRIVHIGESSVAETEKDTVSFDRGGEYGTHSLTSQKSCMSSLLKTTKAGVGLR